MRRTWGLTIPLVGLALVSACGGGGSSSNSSDGNSLGGSGGEVHSGEATSTGLPGTSTSSGGSAGSSAGGSSGSSAGGSAGSSAGGSAGSSAGGSSGSSSGGTAGAGGVPDEPLDFVTFCEAYAEYMCEWMLGCRGFEDCENGGPVSAIRSSCETALPQAIANGDLVFDADQAASCVPDALVCYASPRELTDSGACRGVVHAKGKIGDDCYRTLGWFDQPCAEGYCDMSDQCPGTCTAYTADDAPCGDSPCQPGSTCIDDVCTKLPDVGESCESLCLYGFQCIESDDGKVCVPPVGYGDDCDDSHPCVSPDGCVEGVCGGKLEPGEECTSHVQCPSETRCPLDTDSGMDTCQPLPGVGEVCPTGECNDSFNLLCQDPDPNDDDNTSYCVELGGVDDPCAPNGCANDLWCYYAEDDTEGVCLARGESGDFCSTEGSGPFAGYAPCLSTPTFLICIDEECELPGAIGEPCTPNDWQSCAEGWCSTETSRCVAPAEEGEVCNPNFGYAETCAEGLYCFCEGDECGSDPLVDHGECLPRKAAGEPCQTSLECLSDSCSYDGEADRCADVVDQSACVAPYAPEP